VSSAADPASAAPAARTSRRFVSTQGVAETLEIDADFRGEEAVAVG
jgi:hypothetical protein